MIFLGKLKYENIKRSNRKTKTPRILMRRAFPKLKVTAKEFHFHKDEHSKH